MGRKNPQFLTKLRIFGPSEKIRTSGLLNPIVNSVPIYRAFVVKPVLNTAAIIAKPWYISQNYIFVLILFWKTSRVAFY